MPGNGPVQLAAVRPRKIRDFTAMTVRQGVKHRELLTKMMDNLFRRRHLVSNSD